MNEKKLYIPQGAMDLTKQVCREELAIVCEKHSTSIIELLLRFLKMDLARYCKVAILGFIGMLFVLIIVPQLKTIPISIYFFLLGSMSVFESYKSDHYQTSELFQPVYLRQGRVFLYKNASIALLEGSLFLLFLLCSIALPTLSFVSILLCSLLPLFIIQILMLQLVRYIYHMQAAYVLYASLFAIYFYIYYRFESYLLVHINVSMAMFLAIVCACAFLFNLYLIQKARAKGDILWN